MVLDDHTMITKSISHSLHLVAVVTNRKVSLDKQPKPSIKMKSTSFTIAQEMLYNTEAKRRVSCLHVRKQYPGVRW